MKFRKNDTIKITSGKDKNKTGKIDKITREGVIISSLNLSLKHQKSQGEGKPGARIHIPKPIFFGKFSLICPKCSELTRISFLLTDGKKVRICKKCKNPI